MRVLAKICIIIFFLVIFNDVRSQPGAGDPNGGNKPGAVPISGIEILLVLGSLLGVKKVFDVRKKNN